MGVATGTDVGEVMDLRAGYSPDGSATRLHAYSSHIVPLAADMPPTEKQVGYAFSEPTPFTPPRDLAKFLSEGERPIFVGFGSMPGNNHKRINTALIGALEQTGLRAVIATGWGGIRDLPTNAKVHVLESVPYPWLFPQVAAVVHHGGSGTTHEGLRWGRPTVICPLFADQPFFGQQVAHLGVGSNPIAKKHLTADRLASALDQAMSKKVKATAKSMGSKMADEDGAKTITEMVNSIKT